MPDRDFEAMVNDLDRKLKDVEDKIWIMEGEYLKESANIGNIFKGWDMEKQNARGGSSGVMTSNYATMIGKGSKS